MIECLPRSPSKISSYSKLARLLGTISLKTFSSVTSTVQMFLLNSGSFIIIERDYFASKRTMLKVLSLKGL